MTAKEFYNTIKENKTFEEIMTEFARIKCLEAIKNTRHKSYDLVGFHTTGEHNIDTVLQNIQRKIENILNQDVMPEL